ncbi:transcriptional regulator [Weissella oryzae SG25]|uniref:Transcriptional regulator n=1 Tax=Weissella oryzae (strain DSM 25784 / JCM 18191 / LMG 30913 / SG25) TaxID=1329250 RepID=A0A069CRP3_WEIOS|nr:CopY/TcrY family copper transport repressor [Weissella oryzae]GAK30042.1 transcriptional regulator [Weissella oryzae SG25]
MNEIEITDAEWAVMRVIWTLGTATSKEIASILMTQKGWQVTTVKTFLGRLVKKGALQVEKKQHAFVYESTITEQDSMDKALNNLFGQLCTMKVGNSLANVLPDLSLSQADIKKLQAILTQKAQTAPNTLACDCIECAK